VSLILVKQRVIPGIDFNTDATRISIPLNARKLHQYNTNNIMMYEPRLSDDAIRVLDCTILDTVAIRTN